MFKAQEKRMDFLKLQKDHTEQRLTQHDRRLSAPPAAPLGQAVQRAQRWVPGRRVAGVLMGGNGRSWEGGLELGK